jgi:hypothetical protein
VRQIREQAIHHELVILVVLPRLSGLGAEQVMKLRRAPVFFEPTLKRRDFQIPGVPRPLQHLVVEDGRPLFHGGSCHLLTRQIEEQDRGREALRDCGEEGSRLRLLQAILQMPQKGHSINLHSAIQCQPEIFRERTLARPVKV